MIDDDISESALVLLDKFTYPPLPPITDTKLERAVFTHRSLVNSLPTDLLLGGYESYEKLAHLGDSLLNTFITCLLHAMNPKSRPKTATDLRSKLVNGEINAHISRHYDLPAKVLTARSVGGTFRASDIEAGEVYEAYLAGLFYSYVKAKPNVSPPSASHEEASTDKNMSQDNSNKQNIEESVIEPKVDISSHGQAFDRLSLFLQELYQPLIQPLLDSLSSPLSELLFGDRFQEDILVLSEGAKSELNTLTQKWRLAQPRYSHEYIWPEWTLPFQRKGTHGKVWKSTCTVRKRDGTSLSMNGIGDGAKGPADNVAAYLSCNASQDLLLDLTK
ncbi:uncharacterized protein IL334_005862 [Kwoniella shivajii]|uniref:RNase III domain-containing protein n=1 Tax=Kwoniella shivajii TaxID=564305 RepID=A0ABZ1D4W2_9TREE|nr:hypothetical protein IL334_005862 [Kwoniella shivajii]